MYKVDSKINTLLSYYLPSSVVLNSIDQLFNHKYIITSDKGILNNLTSNNRFVSIKNFDNNFLLMKVSK